MVLYEYCCDDCGDFAAWNTMAKASEAMPCPTCGEPASRIVSVPYLADMDPNNRIAHQRNERSAHEPRVQTGADLGKRHGHGVRHHHGPARQWMIGH